MQVNLLNLSYTKKGFNGFVHYLPTHFKDRLTYSPKVKLKNKKSNKLTHFNSSQLILWVSYTREIIMD